MRPSGKMFIATIVVFLIIFFGVWRTVQNGKRLLTAGDRDRAVVYYGEENGYNRMEDR